jgi:hypothetical protein
VISTRRKAERELLIARRLATLQSRGRHDAIREELTAGLNQHVTRVLKRRAFLPLVPATLNCAGEHGDQLHLGQQFQVQVESNDQDVFVQPKSSRQLQENKTLSGHS